jgi:hypothetical protein
VGGCDLVPWTPRSCSGCSLIVGRCDSISHVDTNGGGRLVLLVSMLSTHSIFPTHRRGDGPVECELPHKTQPQTIPFGSDSIDNTLQSPSALAGFFSGCRNLVLPQLPLRNLLVPSLEFSCAPNVASPQPPLGAGGMTTMQRLIRDNPSDE